MRRNCKGLLRSTAFAMVIQLAASSCGTGPAEPVSGSDSNQEPEVTALGLEELAQAAGWGRCVPQAVAYALLQKWSGGSQLAPESLQQEFESHFEASRSSSVAGEVPAADFCLRSR